MTDANRTPAIDEDALLADLNELLLFPSMGGTPAEVEVQDYVARRWTDEGLLVDRWDIDVDAVIRDPQFPGQEVNRSAAVGVTATLAGDGTGPTLLLNGHTDVVPPGDLASWSADPFVPRTMDVDGRESLVARGSCDMKAGLAAMWAAVRAVQKSGVQLRGNVVLASVSGEEDGGLGTFSLLRHGVTADLCVITEPTSLDIMPANGGALTFRLTVRGRATHASRRTEGVSAIDKLLPIMAALAELEARRNADVDPLMERWALAYPLSIGVVHAGDWASTVPDLLIAEGRLGVALGETIEHARAEFEAAVTEACASDSWLADNPVEVTWWGGQFASGRTPADASVISLTDAAHSFVLGTSPDLYGGPYGSDLRLLQGLGGIPTIQYGPGDARAAHAPNEWVSIEETIDCARVLTRLIVEVCA
ncbi:MAG: ArgE/DapE family deacylase [bacterium]|nr:ArgE/DapE family deacylase [bacterium]